MTSAYTLAARWLVFAVTPWLVLAVGVYAWWVTFYFLAPLFLPFSAYERLGGEWTVFAEEKLGWPINIAYSAVLALLAMWAGRRITFWKAFALFGLILVAASLLLHGLMLTLGYRYWYDTP